MFTSSFRAGVSFPHNEIESDAIAVRDFAQGAEELGFDYIAAADHIVGASIATRPGWKGPYTSDDPFHEPLTLFSYLAGVTRRLSFFPAVIILPQRQTVLFAKQAANLDIFCQGRLRIGVGIGWNDVEYETLGVPFERRGARLDDQIRFLRRLWTEPCFSETTPFHRISDAGLNPLPLQRPIPLWIGGQSPAAIARTVRSGDGWFPALVASEAESAVAQFLEALRSAGRDPRQVGFENLLMVGTHVGRPRRRPEESAEEAMLWKKLGADGVCFHLKLAGASRAAEHLELLRRIAGVLDLKS